jgi:uncharacterized protein YkwD
MRLQRVIWAAMLCGSLSFVVNAATAQNSPTAATPPAVPHQITNADIIEMLQAGISDRIIIPTIQRAPTNFDTSTDALVALKKAGASEALLAVVISAPRFSAQPAAPSTTGGPALSAPMTSPAVVQQQATNGIPAIPAQASVLPGPMVPQPTGTGVAYVPPSLMQPPTNATTSKKQAEATPPLLSDCTNPGVDKVQQAEQLILLLVNNERQKQGSGKLNSSDPLAAVARQHSCRMAQNGFLDHVDPQYGDATQRLQSAGLHVKSLAENLSEGSGPDPTKSAVESWMSDPDHRENMLDSSFACTGVGVAIKPDGTYIVTELFTAAPCAGSKHN